MGIGKFFKGLFGTIFGKSALKKLAEAGKALLSSALGQIAWAVVNELDGANLSTADKRLEALKRIAAKAKEAGLDVKDSAISLLIEMAVQRLKGVVPK